MTSKLKYFKSASIFSNCIFVVMANGHWGGSKSQILFPNLTLILLQFSLPNQFGPCTYTNSFNNRLALY